LCDFALSAALVLSENSRHTEPHVSIPHEFLQHLERSLVNSPALPGGNEVFLR
jgi:hypothetical protein